VNQPMRKTTIAIGAAAAALIVTTTYRLLTNDPTPSAAIANPTVATKAQPEVVIVSSSLPVLVVAPTSTSPGTTSQSQVPETPTSAALRFLDLDEELFPPVTPEKARALTEGIASTKTKAKLAALAEDHQRQAVAKGDLAGLTLRIAPIVSRTRSCNAEMCIVDVYFLRLWSFPGQGALDDYATVEIHVVTENNEWKLESSSLIDGPYPLGRYSARPNLGMNGKAFESTLAGFTDAEITR
jgi:hypothetical protein